jgi:hypothetical protein
VLIHYLGAGGYADNEVGGVSCTGHGESISKVVLAYQIMSLMRQGIENYLRIIINMFGFIFGFSMSEIRKLKLETRLISQASDWLKVRLVSILASQILEI